jgi:hypothetical protein
MPRLLLIETIVPHRFHGGHLFPYMQGWCEEQGIPTRWLRFAVPAGNRRRSADHGVALRPEEIEACRVALAGAESPTHVVFSHRPSDDLLRALAQGLGSPAGRGAHVGASVGSPPAPRWGLVSTDANASAVGSQQNPASDNASAELEVLPSCVQALSSWFGVRNNRSSPAISREDLFEQAPRYKIEMANAAAQRLQPTIFMFCGANCLYRQSLQTNQFWRYEEATRGTRGGAEDLAWDALPARWGCTFCSNAAHGEGGQSTEAVLGFFSAAPRLIRGGPVAWGRTSATSRGRGQAGPTARAVSSGNCST